MPEIYFNNRSLPLDVIVNIMQKSSKRDLCNYSLVCKSWSEVVQSILFSVVKIKSLSQLETLDETVSRKPRLGEQVKVLSVWIANDNKDATTLVTKHLSNLLNNGLPNLLELPECSLKSYNPVLSALKNSRLKSLRVLYPPDEGGKMGYASCILLMKNRVEKIKMSSGNVKRSTLASDDLFKNLDQFSMLKEFEIRDESVASGIQTIEHITATCKNLKKLIFGSNSRLTDAAVEVYPPSKNIEYFYGHLQHCESLPYIMHKFPHLHTLIIDFWYSKMKLEDYGRLLRYLSAIDTVNLGRITINRGVIEATANYWEETSAALGSKTVGVCCYDGVEEDCALEIRGQSSFFFVYYVTDYESQHTEILDKMGKYIGEFHLDYEVENSGYIFPENEDLPKQVMHYLSLHCPHLRTLDISGFVLRARDVPQQTLSFSKLHFKQCVFVGAFLSRLSSHLPHLKRLVLEQVSHQPKIVRISNEDRYVYDDYAYDRYRALEINMPETKINKIILTHVTDGPLHMKLFVAENKKYHYYRRDHRILLPSTAKEYNGTEEYDRIYLRCFNKPRIILK